MISVSSLVNDLHALGLSTGDTVMVHASLRKLGSVEGGHEAVLEAIADIPGKRRVRLEMPLLSPTGEKTWMDFEDWDSNGITDRFAATMECGGMDAVETIARAYVMLDRHAEAKVGQAPCYLFDARDLARFGVAYLERHAGA